MIFDWNEKLTEGAEAGMVSLQNLHRLLVKYSSYLVHVKPL